MIATHRYHLVVLEPATHGPVRRGAILCCRDGEPIFKLLIEHDDGTGITTYDPLHDGASRIEMPVAVFERLSDLARDLRLRLEREAAPL